MIVRGVEGLTIRSIRKDRKVPLRSVEYSLRIVYCISLGRFREGGGWLTIRSIRTDRQNAFSSVEWSLRIVYCSLEKSSFFHYSDSTVR